MEPYECPVCHKTIKWPTKWHLRVHEELSERHKTYLQLKQSK